MPSFIKHKWNGYTIQAKPSDGLRQLIAFYLRADLLGYFYGTNILFALQFQRQVELRRYETAFTMLHKLRAAVLMAR